MKLGNFGMILQMQLFCFIPGAIPQVARNGAETRVSRTLCLCRTSQLQKKKKLTRGLVWSLRAFRLREAKIVHALLMAEFVMLL